MLALAMRRFTHLAASGKTALRVAYHARNARYPVTDLLAVVRCNLCNLSIFRAGNLLLHFRTGLRRTSTSSICGREYRPYLHTHEYARNADAFCRDDDMYVSDLNWSTQAERYKSII